MPDFENPIDIFDVCHQRIRRHCHVLERLARSAAASKEVDVETREAARTVIRNLDEAGANHHQDEEDDLFPALERAANGRDKHLVEVLVARLKKEHVELDTQWQALRRQLQDLADGKPVAINRDAALVFTRACDRHIEIEQASLLPLARSLLDAETLERLGRSMAGRRGDKFPGV